MNPRDRTHVAFQNSCMHSKIAVESDHESAGTTHSMRSANTSNAAGSACSHEREHSLTLDNYDSHVKTNRWLTFQDSYVP
jgi:hypothetical protein